MDNSHISLFEFHIGIAIGHNSRDIPMQVGDQHHTALRLCVHPKQHCMLLMYIQKNTLQTAPVSDAPVSVGTVRVASAKKGLGVAHLSKHVRLAMREVLSRFQDVS